MLKEFKAKERGTIKHWKDANEIAVVGTFSFPMPL